MGSSSIILLDLSRQFLGCNEFLFTSSLNIKHYYYLVLSTKCFETPHHCTLFCLNGESWLLEPRLEVARPRNRLTSCRASNSALQGILVRAFWISRAPCRTNVRVSVCICCDLWLRLCTKWWVDESEAICTVSCKSTCAVRMLLLL